MAIIDATWDLECATRNPPASPPDHPFAAAAAATVVFGNFVLSSRAKSRKLLPRNQVRYHLLSRLINRMYSLRGLCVLCLLMAGCSAFSHAPRGAVVWIDNPMTIHNVDREFLWTQLVDELDDFFPIAREERIREAGGVLTEGRIETRPVVGATLLEPWLRDSTPGFERRHATLQSIRRRAIARVWPVPDGYQIEVIVLKELEEVERSEFSPGGDVVFRHDGTLVRQELGTQEEPQTLSWIPMGRDLSLEQQILAELRARIGAVVAPQIPVPN